MNLLLLNLPRVWAKTEHHRFQLARPILNIPLCDKDSGAGLYRLELIIHCELVQTTLELAALPTLCQYAWNYVTLRIERVYLSHVMSSCFRW